MNRLQRTLAANPRTVLFTLVVQTAILIGIACTPKERQDAVQDVTVAVDAVAFACGLAHPSEDEVELAQACALDKSLSENMARGKKVAREHAARMSDAGTDR